MHALTQATPSAVAAFERIARIAAVLLALVAAGVVIEQLVTGPSASTSAALQLPIPEPEPAATLPPPDWRLFGQPAAIDYGLAAPVEPTPLALRLRGAVSGERGYAIIVDAEGNEGVYRVGDELPGDARVVEIESRRVLLRRAGRTEALELPAGAGSGGAVARTRAPANRSGASNAVTGIGIGSLSALTAPLALNPDALAQQITIMPVTGGGFRVRAGRDATLFTQLGFQLNDVVTAINGQPVSTEADVRAVFENYNPSERLAITVRRGDRQLVLTPSLSDF